MLVSRSNGYSPIQNNTGKRAVPTMAADRAYAQDGRFDSISLSGSAQTESSDFRQLVASLSQQVRTTNTTGKVQELREQVQSGTYAISPTDIAARMLLLEEGV